MKVKTSITLSEDIIKIIDQESKQYKSRSDFIETVLQNHIKQAMRDNQNKRDRDIIDREVDYLNKEAEDVLNYQVAL